MYVCMYMYGERMVYSRVYTSHCQVNKEGLGTRTEYIDS